MIEDESAEEFLKGLTDQELFLFYDTVKRIRQSIMEGELK